VKKTVKTMTRQLNTILKGLEKLAVEGKHGEPQRQEPEEDPISSS